jgi:hypothetical protein
MVGEMVTLTGKSKRGKERVERDGSTGWKVREIKDRISFTDKRGPWLLLDNGKPKAMRWVHATDDDHFIIVEL